MSFFRGVIVVLKLSSGFRSLAIGSALTMAMGALANPVPPGSQKNSPTDPSLHKRMMRHEARFYENKGQWDHRGQYLTRRPGLDLWFEDRGVDFEYYQVGGSHNHPTRTGQTVAMHFVGSGSNLKFKGVQPTKSVNDYLLGKKKVLGVRGYAELHSKDVFPGIDFRGYYSGDSARYDFIVAPHADPTAVALKFDGAKSVSVTKDGIQLGTQIGDRLQGDLHVYQQIGGHRVSIPASFKLVAKNEVRLSVGSYDKSKPLVVDPLVYGTYWGGDGGWDEVRSVVADSTQDGAVYLTGDTQSALFPVTAGPFFLNLKGIQNAYVARLQGDAFNEDYSAFIGGSVVDAGQFIKLDPHGNVVIAGTSTSSDFPQSVRDNKILVTGDPSATGGQFVLTNGFSESQALPFNVPLYVGNVAHTLANLNPQWIQAFQEIGVFSALDPNSPPTNPGNLPLNFGGTFEFDFKPDAAPGFPFAIINARIGDNTGEFSSGLPFVVVNYFQTDAAGNTTTNNLTPEASAATGGAFSLSFTTLNANGTPNVQTTAALNIFSTAAQIQKAIQAVSNIGQLTTVVTDLGPGRTSAPSNQTMATDIMQVQFTLNGVVQSEIPLTFNDLGLSPKPSYSVNLFPFVWSFVFQPTGTTLTPVSNSEESFGNAFGTELNGFDIKQVPNPSKTLADDIVFSGNTSFQIPEFKSIPYDASTDGTEKGFMVRMNLSPFGGSGANYTLTGAASSYITGSFPVANRGIVLDANGSAYAVGTVFGQGNTDTSVNPVFTTTPGVFASGTFSSAANGRLLRNFDIFVRKYSPNSNSIVWSGLLGGHANDEAGGWFFDMDGSDVATGSAIALDPAGSVYVTGLATSYDFPRTRGVYGENFTDADAVSVTKISNDGSNVIYSTNLNSSGLYIAAGIGIDAVGDAVVTGNDIPLETFPENTGAKPGDPDQPTSTFYGSIGTTSDAFETTYTGQAPPQIGTISSWVNVISPDATSLVYGSYLGGQLDNRVYAPYVDPFGDTWLYGWVETFREYSLVSSTGSVTTYIESASLPNSMLSPNAFKDYPDEEGSTGDDQVAFGFYDAFGFTVAPFFIFTESNRDGWVVKLRIGLPSVASLTFNPSTVPGGAGSTSTGTVTLSAAAPANGALVNLTLVSGSGASFSSTSQVGTSSITIPAGSTSGTFTVYTSAVSAVTPVTFNANYLGSFQNATLNVEPYLAGFSLSPATVVGGNQTTATITLVQPAPSNGVTITLSTPNSAYLTFPDGNTVTIPSGQTTASVPIQTVGVLKNIQVSASASVSGYSISQSITLTPATLASLTFNPTSVADGNSSVGTISLNGLAGGPLSVTMESQSGVKLPTGVTISPANVISIPAGQSSTTFTVNVPPASVNPMTSLTLVGVMGSKQGTATNYPTSSVSGTLQILPNSISSFTVSPSSITAGGIAIGTVTLQNPAPSAGLNLTVTSSSTSAVSFAASASSTTWSPTLTLTIPSGSTTGTFAIQGGFVQTNTPVKISVAKAGQTSSQTITVTPPALTLSLNPTEVVGGTSSTATLSIPVNAVSNLTFKLSETASPTSSPTGSLPSTVTIPAGSSSVTFTVGTKPVSTSTTLTITAISSTNSNYKATAQLIVDETGIASLVFSPTAFHSVVQTTSLTITLTGPAPSAGLVVHLSASGTNYFTNLPASVTVPAGATTYTINGLRANEVSRNIDETVNGSTTDGNSSASGVVTIETP